MKIIKCKKDGHVYNRDKFDKCPVCGTPWDESKAYGETIKSSEDDNPGRGVKTDPTTGTDMNNQTPILNHINIDSAGGSVEQSIRPDPNGNGSAEEENILTPVHSSAFSPRTSFPIAILVAIQGIHKGEIYELFRGQNTVGRGEDMKIKLEKDETVSRNTHCIILADENDRCFVKTGQSRGMTYLNNKVIFATTELQDRDVIAIGKTELLLVKICSNGFSWTSDGE